MKDLKTWIYALLAIVWTLVMAVVGLSFIGNLLRGY